MKINLAMITKGDSELTSLKRAIGSVEKYVQGVYVTTNGKHEKTKKWLESKGYNHSHLDWDDDFGTQRNFNFSQVPDCDYILWLDSDDVMVGAQHLEEVAQITKRKEKEVAFLNYWYGCTFDGEPSEDNLIKVEMDQKRERLIKPGVMKWKKRLHETPIPNPGAKYDHIVFPYGKENPIAVLHLGASTDQTMEQNLARNARNQRILERQLEEERLTQEGADPRTLLYLMKIYTESDKPEEWEQCLLMGSEYLKKSGWNEERAICCILIGRCYGHMGDNKKAIRILHEALSNYPFLPTVYLRLSEAYFNEGMLAEAKLWLETGLARPFPKESSMQNILEMEHLSAAMSVKILYNYEHNTKKAYEAAVKLAEIDPRPEVLEQLDMLENLSKLDDACRRVDFLTRYLEEIDEIGSIVPILDVLPEAITAQPFAQRLRHKYMSPRKWGPKEICYFATFGGKAFEPWGPKSLEKGVGGSETAVIMLSKEWAKKGYSVVVYGDPEHERGTIDGVTYLPWYYFNPKDHFNIFIQWRNASLCDKIKCKKFLVDLHDIYFGGDYEDKQDKIDRIMVKSKYHRSLAKDVPNDKFNIISNGVI